MASWISATPANWSPFNFIFNLGNRKWFDGDKSGDYGGVMECFNIFWGQKLGKHLQLFGRAHYRAKRKISRADILFLNPKNYSLGDVQRFCYHS
jgi:hypothetical protein